MLRPLNLALLLALALPLAKGCAPTISAQNLSEAVTGSTFNRQGEYIIGGTDELSIQVFGDKTLTGTYQVSPTGVLTFPLIGFVEAEGLTSLQLTYKLEKALAPYIKGPKVTVMINSRNSYEVYFSGEVNKPGSFKLQSHTSILQGIALAGGLSKFASGRVVIIRTTPDGVRRYATDYEELLGGRNNVDLFILERGDVVHAE